MPRATVGFLIIGLSGLACALAFSLVGGHVDAGGFLREPFFLIPIGFLLMLVGATGALLTALRSMLAGLRPR